VKNIRFLKGINFRQSIWLAVNFLLVLPRTTQNCLQVTELLSRQDELNFKQLFIQIIVLLLVLAKASPQLSTADRIISAITQ